MTTYETEFAKQYAEEAKIRHEEARLNKRLGMFSATLAGVIGSLSVEAFSEGGGSNIALGALGAVGVGMCGYMAHAQLSDAIESTTSACYFEHEAEEASKTESHLLK